MKNIQTCMWFDRNAEEAANFYVSTFKSAKLGKVARYGKSGAEISGQSQGTVMTAEFEIDGIQFLALNGGPIFKIDPSISFFVACDDEAELNALWAKLNQKARMPVGEYPWAKRYGWCEDRFGVNWQLMLGPKKQKVTPALLFANQKYGKAESAIKFYVETFPNSKIESIARDEKSGAVVHSSIKLSGHDFILMEGPLEKEYDFSCAVSFIVGCESQTEIDIFWSALSASPQDEQCGWLKDKFGVSWQIVPSDWGQWISQSSPEVAEKLMMSMLKMKKFDVETLRKIAGSQ